MKGSLVSSNHRRILRWKVIERRRCFQNQRDRNPCGGFLAGTGTTEVTYQGRKTLVSTFLAVAVGALANVTCRGQAPVGKGREIREGRVRIREQTSKTTCLISS